MSREPFALKHGNVFIVPVCHYQMEFAAATRQAIRHFQPAQIAIEMPPHLGEAYLTAVKRLPYLSVLVTTRQMVGGWTPEESARSLESLPPDVRAELDQIPGLRARLEEPGSPLETVELMPIEPCDAFVEAARLALERDVPLHFVDVAVNYPEVMEPMPDSYALFHIGLEEYWNAYEAVAGNMQRAPEDDLRERHMAWEIARRKDQGPLLLVCGMAHARGVLSHLQRNTGQEAEPHEVSPVRLFNPNSAIYSVLGMDTPFCATAYQVARDGPGPDSGWEPPPKEEPRLQTSRLDQLDRSDAVASLEKLLGLGKPKEEEPKKPEPHWSLEFKRMIAAKLQELKQKQLDVNSLLEGGGTEAPLELESAPTVPQHMLSVFKFKDCEARKPELKRAFVGLAEKHRAPDGYLDRHRLTLAMWELAAHHYTDNTGEQYKQWQKRVMRQFVRNYTTLTGHLLPTVYQSAVGARGVADDNYAWEMWELGHFYPWVDGSGTHPTIEMEGDELVLGEQRIPLQMIRFNRRVPRLRERPLPGKGRKAENTPGEWEKASKKGNTICSYPPEDIIIEDYGRYLQKKAVTVLSEERTRVEPFTSSLLDGLDMRETIRNWADGQQLYVRETQKIHGGTGSVVLIFDEDLPDRKFPWKMTWHGEHAQESDMAFYATPAQSKIVGPGISRCEYGGLMMTYPPRRMLDIWRDPFYLQQCQTKAEMLLLAGIEYSEDKFIAYVAAKPPRSYFRTVASKINKKIVYLPIGQLSPVSLKKIRVFHVLNNYDLRRIAKDYIW